MGALIRVMCWNIDEGRTGGRPKNSMLPAIAARIRANTPDVVLLNELKNSRRPWGDGINQVEWLSSQTGIPFRHWANTASTGPTGHKAVACLSRYPLGPARVHPVMRGSSKTAYATLETTFNLDGRVHHVFSTRFDAYEPKDNVAGHLQARDIVNRLGPGVAVIFGGDFNADRNQPQLGHFMNGAALRNVAYELPDPTPCCELPKDHVFFRGPFRVTQMEQRCPPDNPSDHPWILAELMSPPEGFVATYGRVCKLRHLLTGRALHSHGLRYGHAGSSGQQQVTAYEGADDNDLWRVKGPHGEPEAFRSGQPVRNGGVIRLEHVWTRRNLHSHAGFPSPVVPGQQEVTCYREAHLGDSNDNWRIEIDGADTWEVGRHVRLIHVNSSCALHSHGGQSHPQWTAGQQEVTGFPSRDDNDWWRLVEAY